MMSTLSKGEIMGFMQNQSLDILTLPSSILLVVVSTSSVVWSQVRWFFLMRNVFCTINHDE